MLYTTAIRQAKEDMEKILSQEGLENYYFSLKRMKQSYTKGEHNFDNKEIRINTDVLFFNIERKDNAPIYTPFPKPFIQQAVLDAMRISFCHEVTHAKDFSFPMERLETKEERERFALEDIACTNPKFYKGSPYQTYTNYAKISFEARAFTKSITMARDFIMNNENVSLEEANQRIINALNYEISDSSLFKVMRKNPNYNPYYNAMRDGEYIPGSSKEYLDDISFHNFDEVEQAINNVLDASRNHDFIDYEYPRRPPGAFDPIYVKQEFRDSIQEINKDIESLGFTREFYCTLSQKERLYFNAAIAIKYYDRYKELNPNCRTLPERLERHKEAGFLVLEKLDLSYFERKLKTFLDSHKPKIKEPEPDDLMSR